MESNHDREIDAQRRLRDIAVDDIAGQPWRPGPPSATDLIQFALWKSKELSEEDLSQALALLPAMRAEAEIAEIGLLFTARAEGMTWAQIAEATGFKSPQACQQHFNRLSSRAGGN